MKSETGDYRAPLCQVLNLLDGCMTLIFISFGIEEANPAVRMLLDSGYLAYIGVKFCWVALCIETLNRYLTGRSRMILTLLIGLLGAICSYHWAALLYLLRT